MTPEKNPEIMRPKDAAAFFGCGTATLYRWIKSGIIPPPHKHGLRFVYWLKSELESVLHGQPVERK